MPVADSEIVFGAYTEYTGLRFAFFLLSEYAGIVVMSLLFAVLYLGGWHGLFSDQLGWLWTLLKGFCIAVVVIWLRVAWPRLREDQLQRLAWLVLVPLALAQLALTGIWVVTTA
jgi:NADH-quinone oxidoreductase subunit H